IRRAKAAGIKSVPTGIDHGTVTLVVDAQPFEITTLREDTETFGRKAKVAFGRDWVMDAKRRDFTINGMSVDAAGVVHDHVGGLEDIAAKRVRFIGDPDQRLAEDSMGHRWWRLAGMDEATARRRLYRLGEDRYRDRLMLAWARSGGDVDFSDWRQLATLPERWRAPTFPLKAADFIARGIGEGPALGQVLALAEDAWIAANFPLDEAA